MAGECRLSCTLVALGPVSWEQLAKLSSQEKMNKERILHMRQDAHWPSCLVSCSGTEQWWNCPWMWQSASGRETRKWSLHTGRESAFITSQCQVLSLLYGGTAPHPTVQLRESSEQWLSPSFPSLSRIRDTSSLWWWAWVCFDSSLLLLAWPGALLTVSYWTQSFPTKLDSR